MSDPTPVFDNLREESEELDRLVAELSAEQWALAPGARLERRPARSGSGAGSLWRGGGCPAALCLRVGSGALSR